MNKEEYKTKQKSLILDIIKKQKGEFKVQDIYLALNKKVGLTTIYRLIDKLYGEGLLNKTISKDNIAYYQYLEECSCENHFYLKCEKCGNLIHVDCDCIGGLLDHILEEHKFKANREHIIINGLCSLCRKR